jgi:hypothetical protein
MVQELSIDLHNYEKIFMRNCSYGEIFLIQLLSKNISPLALKTLIMDIVYLKKTLKNKAMTLQETIHA